MPAVGEAVTAHANEVWRLVRRRSIAVAATKIRTRLDVVADASGHALHYTIANVLPILRVILRLLTVNERNSIDIVILMICILITSHDQIFLCFFQTDWTYGLGALARDIDISHVLI